MDIATYLWAILVLIALFLIVYLFARKHNTMPWVGFLGYRGRGRLS
jgi:hypothetical protein